MEDWGPFNPLDDTKSVGEAGEPLGEEGDMMEDSRGKLLTERCC